jgi:membrane fusion protein, multidrug efflux system
MSTDADRDDETGPDTLTDDEFLAGLGELEAYQARHTAPAMLAPVMLAPAMLAPPTPPAARPSLAIRAMMSYRGGEALEDMKGAIALTSWPTFAAAFALSFGAVLWLSRGGPSTMGPSTASIAGNAIPASEPIAAPSVAASALSVGQAGNKKIVPVSSPVAPLPVMVQTSRAVKRDQMFNIRGRTEAAARVSVKAEISGVVESVGVAKGAKVQKGDELCALQQRAQNTALAQAHGQLAQAQLDTPGKTQLAEAAVKKAELDMARTRIVAPFPGFVEEQPAKPGALMNVGSVCAVVIAPDPLFVVGAVAEKDVSRVKQGMKGTAKLATGEIVAGSISFVASAAEANSRVFRVELQVPNADGKLRDGVTATLQLATNSEPAHILPPSALTMNDAGALGVRVVDQAQKAKFMPVKVLGDERERIWVSGLPAEVKIIVVGQDYLTDGQRVAVTERQPPLASR